MTIADVSRRRFEEVLAQYEPIRPADPALMGDGLGNVAVSGRDGFVYIRVGSELVVGQAYNNRVPNRENLPIIVGYSSDQPALFQVLSIREVYAGADSGHDMIPQVVAHHNSHELGNADGGDDVVYVQKQQILPLLAYETDPASMYINVASDWYPWQSGFKFFAGATSADLSGYVPATSGQARYLLVSVDGATNILQYTEGDTWSLYLPPADLSSLVPDAPAGSVPVVAIYLPYGTTALTRETNLYDVRILISPVGGSLLPAVHDHSDAANGGATLGPLAVTVTNEGLHILDTGGDHDLIIKPGTDLGADRILTLTTGDAARTITLSGNPTLADWFDQAVKAASTPTFASQIITDAGYVGLGAAKGRIEFNDEAVDNIQFLDCNVGAGCVPAYRLDVNSAGTNVVASFTSTDQFAQLYLADNGSTDPELVRRNVDITSFFAGGVEHINLKGDGEVYFPNGNVGVGGVPDKRFTVKDDVSGVVASFYNDGNNNNRQGILVQCGADANSASMLALWLDGDGGIIGYVIGDGGTGVTYHSASDIRSKEVIENINQDKAITALREVKALEYVGKGLTTETGQHNIGFSAQAMAVYFPEVTRYDKEADLYTMDYGRVTPILWAQNQAQQAEIDALKARIEKLEE